MPDIIDELRYEMDRIHDLKDRAQGAEFRLRKKCQRLLGINAELLAALKGVVSVSDRNTAIYRRAHEAIAIAEETA